MSKRMVAQVGAVLFFCTTILAFLILTPAQPLVHAALAAQQAAVLQDPDSGAFPPVISYQARVTDPTTGQSKANGSYQMVFSLYVGAETGGSPAWTETKTLLINGGMLNTLLGDVTALPTNLFNSSDLLYLGITFAGNPELTPRQRLAYASHAIFSNEAAHAVSADQSTNAGNASKLNGQDAAFYAKASHQHSGEDITSGVVAETFVDDALARDSEVIGLVTANDGSGSGVDADYFDGVDSTSFAKTYNGTQVNQTTALAAGGQEYWFSFGYSADQLVLWRVIPSVVGAKMKLEIETEMSNNNTVTYWLRVYNTGTVASGYQLVRYHFYQ